MTDGVNQITQNLAGGNEAGDCIISAVLMLLLLALFGFLMSVS
jgi:hypothetical protein